MGDMTEQPGSEMDEEKAETEGAESDDEKREEALAPRHVARADATGVVVTAALLPRLPPEELHRQIVEQALQEVAVDVRAEADVDVEHGFDDAKEPVGHGTLGAQHDAEHAEDGRNAGDDAVETKITLDDPRDDGERHDGRYEEDLEPVEAAEGEPKQGKIAVACHFEKE